MSFNFSRPCPTINRCQQKVPQLSAFPVALFPYKHPALPLWVQPVTTVSTSGEEDQDMRQIFRMHCTALQFRWGGNESASEQELAELCEPEVSVTQKSPVFFCILLSSVSSADVHHLTARENLKPTSFFDLRHNTKILLNYFLMKIGWGFFFSVFITLFHPAVFSSCYIE